MNNSLEILEQINWFLEPIADLFIFLFTTSSGYAILITFLILYFIFSIANALKVRKIAHRGAKSNFVPINEIIYIVGSEIVKIFLKIISNLPVVLTIILIIFGIVGLSTSFKTINQFVENNIHIKELETTLKHLNQSYRVADFKIKDINKIDDKTTLEISFFDYEKNDYLSDKQTITIDGNDIYFLCYVLNFDYSEIESGEKRNIVIPYKIFSEKIPSSKGIVLDLIDTSGVPYIFHRKDDEIFGITPKVYNQCISELSEYLFDETKAKEIGIRSFYEAAPHTYTAYKVGDEFSVWVEQTGGLVLKKTEEF